MTPWEKAEVYYRATGMVINEEIAARAFKDEACPWFKKLVKMASPSIFQDLQGVYTEDGRAGINPIDYEGVK